MRPVAGAAQRAARERKQASPDNPFLALEKLWAASVVQSFDLMRDLRDAAYELSFFAIYGRPR